MTFKSRFIFVLFLSILSSATSSVFSQHIIKGIVTDSINNEPLPFVSVYLKGTSIGTVTDNNGKFTLKIPHTNHILKISSLGYKEKILKPPGAKDALLTIRLFPTSKQMDEIVVRSKGVRYKKKNNPAVFFVKKVIDSKGKYSPLNKDFFSFEKYEKISIALNNFQKDKHKNLLKRFDFLINYVDTSNISGKPILPFSSKEMIENYFYQNSPRIDKRIIKAKKSSGIDEMLSDEGVEDFLNEIFKDVNIYDNDISLFLKQFVSPLSTGGPDFYKYYLIDTVRIAGDECMNLGFVPFLSESTGFTGNIYVTLDSTNFIKKVKLSIPKNINLNFVQKLAIDQEFERATDGTRLLTKDDITVEFALNPKSDALYARRTSSYSKHSFEKPIDLSVFNQNGSTITDDDAGKKPQIYWKESRPDSTLSKKKSVDKMLQQLRKNPLYYYSEKVFTALVIGYIPTSSTKNLFTLGPMYSSISTNSVEGVRLRAGGLTTVRLNDQLFGKGFLAYGTNDHVFKFNAEIEYSFNKKKEIANEYPYNSIKLATSYDLNRLGQQYRYSPPDNFFLSIKRQPDSKMTYQRKIELSYNRDFYSQLSLGAMIRYRTEFATPQYVPFTDNNSGQPVQSYSMGEMQLKLRYAPGEKIYQSIGSRRPISRNAPVFSLQQNLAVKGVLGSDYDYCFTELGFQKRFWFSAYGNANVILNAGKVWTKNPFPILIIPNANLSYTIQYESYPMMNALEFINDQYFSWDLNYNMNGLILNRIPLLKKLKLREIISFRGLYGSLNNKNNPTVSAGLYNFPTESYKMGKDPYIEAGVGVENIFNFLRVDYVWRLTYLDHPNIDKSGIRISLNFSF
jgi:hypothetical protein